MVTTVVEAWKMCSNGVGTTAKNIWNALKWLIDLACNIWIGTLEWVGRIWKGLTDCVGEIWNRLKRLAEWIFATMMWADECVYHGGLWVAERYWVCAEWLAACAWNGTEWIWDQIEWLNGVSKENASWLTKKAWIGSKQWAEWAWGEAKRLIDWSWKTIKRNGKPLEPALENVLETFSLFIKFYNEYIHGESKAWWEISLRTEWKPLEIFLYNREMAESSLNFFNVIFLFTFLTDHLLRIKSHIIVSTWRETGYTISVVLVMNCVVLAVYMLISWPVKSIWRRRWVEERNTVSKKIWLRYFNTFIHRCCRQLFRKTTCSAFFTLTFDKLFRNLLSDENLKKCENATTRRFLHVSKVQSLATALLTESLFLSKLTHSKRVFVILNKFLSGLFLYYNFS